MGLDGVGDRKGRRRSHTMTLTSCSWIQIKRQWHDRSSPAHGKAPTPSMSSSNSSKSMDIVGGIAPGVLNSLIIMILYHRSYGRTWTSEITKNRGRLTPGLNNMLSRGYSYEPNAIYLEEIHLELMEF